MPMRNKTVQRRQSRSRSRPLLIILTIITISIILCTIIPKVSIYRKVKKNEDTTSRTSKLPIRTKKYFDSNNINPLILLNSFFRPNIISQIKNSKQKTTETKGTRKKQQQHRIAIIIPYISSNNDENNLPAFFDAFASTASGSSSLIDFLIFHDGSIEPSLLPTTNTYPNIKFINLESKENMIQLLAKVIIDNDEDNRRTANKNEKIVDILKIILIKYPYILVEFKPAYGHIFEEYIDMNYYTHWGYSDLDIIFGDLPRWITNDELTNYDIVTYGYGDQHRLYLRGQFTFHKNNNQTKYLYQPCTYLTHMDIRFEQISSGKKEFKLESAEGCYSQAVLQRDDINIKYAVKAMNDLSPDNHEGADTKTTHSHGVFIAYPNKHNNNSNNQTIIFKTANEYSDPKPFFWFQNNKDYQNKQIPLQQEVGDKLPIRTTRDKNTKCMYWAPQKYQTDLCIDDDSIDSTDTIFYLEGKLYKQKHEVLSFGNDDNIISYPFFHFQEWKRKYRYNQLSSFRTNKKYLDGIVLVKEGAIPLLYQSNDNNDVTTSASTLDQRIFEFMSSSLSMQQSLPSNIVYCLSSSKDGDCNYSITWQNSNILFLFKGSSWVQHNDIQQLSNDVSLILILSLSSKQVEDESVLNGFLSLISKNIRAWGMQPFVLLLHISCAETEGIRFTLYNHFHRSHDRYHPSSMIAVIYSLRGIDDDIIVSRNTLLNMAQSAARTRFVVIGLELERGMVISRESSYFSKRAVLIHGNEDTGLVFYIPQIASKEFFGTYTDGTFSVSDILEERKVRSHLFALDLQSYDCKPSSSSSSSCDDNFEKKSDLNDNIHQTIMDLWWHITSNEMNGENIDINNLYTQYFNIQKLLLELSQSNNQKQLYSFDTHPILLKDKIAPSSSKASNMNMMSTSDLVPYIEEFGGRRCYNAIHLIQLIILGYKFQLLPGAIAMSYPSSREKVCTTSSEQQRTTNDDISKNDPKGEKKNVHDTTTVGISRCDGCYMLSEDDSIIDDIWEDELARSAKTAILTNEY